MTMEHLGLTCPLILFGCRIRTHTSCPAVIIPYAVQAQSVALLCALHSPCLTLLNLKTIRQGITNNARAQDTDNRISLCASATWSSSARCQILGASGGTPTLASSCRRWEAKELTETRGCLEVRRADSSPPSLNLSWGQGFGVCSSSELVGVVEVECRLPSSPTSPPPALK